MPSYEEPVLATSAPHSQTTLFRDDYSSWLMTDFTHSPCRSQRSTVCVNDICLPRHYSSEEWRARKMSWRWRGLVRDECPQYETTANPGGDAKDPSRARGPPQRTRIGKTWEMVFGNKKFITVSEIKNIFHLSRNKHNVSCVIGPLTDVGLHARLG